MFSVALSLAVVNTISEPVPGTGKDQPQATPSRSSIEIVCYQSVSGSEGPSGRLP